jgi:parallel beta-helix repeat protein
MHVVVEDKKQDPKKWTFQKKLIVIGGIIAALFFIIGGYMMLAPQPVVEPVIVDPTLKVDFTYELGIIPDAHDQRVVKITNEGGSVINNLSTDLWITFYPPESTPYPKRSIAIDSSKYKTWEEGESIYVYIGIDDIFHSSKEIPAYSDFIDFPNGAWEVHIDDAIHASPISKYKFEIYDSKTQAVISSGQLQNIIDAVQPYDTVIVSGEIYHDQVHIAKPLRLIGVKYPVIDAGGSNSPVTIEANDVMLKGFVLINSGSTESTYAGVFLKNARNAQVIDNKIKQNTHGIYLYGSASNFIKNNTVSNNDIAGIVLNSGSDKNTVKYNDFSYNTIGIYLLGNANTNYIVQNTGRGNTRYGILIENRLRNTYEFNNFGADRLSYDDNTTRFIDAYNNEDENPW